MKVKKLLKKLYNTEYLLINDDYAILERGFSGVRYDTISGYGNRKVKSVNVGNNNVLRIAIKEGGNNDN